MAPGARVRHRAARHDPGGEPAARDPGDHRDRARGLRGRRSRHGLHARGGARTRSGCSAPSPRARSGNRARSPTRSPAPTGRRCSVRSRASPPTIFVAVIAALFNVSGIELVLHTDLDSNRELRDAGIVNVVSGAFGGIPGYHALSLSALGEPDGRAREGRGTRRGARSARGGRVRRRGDRADPPRDRRRGARLRRPRLHRRVGLGQASDRCPRGEYVVVLAILATVVTRGLLPGVASDSCSRSRCSP